MLPSPCQYKVGTREYGFRSSMAGLRLHSPMLHPEHYCSQRRVRGQSDWLSFLCKTLSFSVSSRFIPALSLAPFMTPFIAQWRVVAGICAYQNMISWDSMGALHQ